MTSLFALMGVGGLQVSGGAATTFDPGTLTGPVSLSGSNLIATATSGAAGNNNYAYSTTSFSTGKKGYKLTCGTINDFVAVGIKGSPDSIVAYNNGTVELGTPFVGGSGIGNSEAWTTSSVLLIMYDFDANLFWLKVGAGNWNDNVLANPATGVGGFDGTGLDEPGKAYVTFDTSGNSVTADFSGSGFPVGFTSF